MLLMLIQIADILLTAVWWVIIIQAIMSWLMAFGILDMRNDFVSQAWGVLDRLTEPLYRPFRRIIPNFGAFDLTPMVVLILIIIIQGPVLGYLAKLAIGVS